METLISRQSLDRKGRYKEMIPQIEELLREETDFIANLANTAATLKLALKDEASWIGFYLVKAGELVLGPFQGKPACVRIQLGKGVCGTAAKERRTLIVPDVKKFPGHISCDPESKSEIVVPLLGKDAIVGVLDVDSLSLNSFDETDQHYLEQVGQLLMERLP